MWIIRITPDEPGVPRITRITQDYSGFPWTTPDYSGLPRIPIRITKWSSRLPQLFPPREFRGLLRMKDYTRLLQFTPMYPELPVQITK